MSYRKKHIKSRIRRLKPKKPFYKKLVFLVPVLILTISTISYFTFFYSKFQVSSIVILGNNKVEKEDIEKIAKDNINKKFLKLGNWSLISKSIFLANSKTITDDILNKIPQIEIVKASKKFPSTIQLEVKEREPSAVFCNSSEEECFYLDKNGIAFERIWGNAYGDITLVKNFEDKKISFGETVIEENIIRLILKIKSDLDNKFGIKATKSIISNPSRLDVYTSENWQIYFSLDSDTDLEVAKMNILLKDEISKDQRKTLQYIDLRFKDRAYYK